LVHIQEGAFMPPRTPDKGLPDGPGTSATLAAATAATPAGSVAAAAVSASHEVGLGEEAREFIMQQLPLFQVREAHIGGLCFVFSGAVSHRAAAITVPGPSISKPVQWHLERRQDYSVCLQLYGQTRHPALPWCLKLTLCTARSCAHTCCPSFT
jgi:hypothetical protein